MRDIKFRAWDERKEIMHNDFEFITSGSDGNDWIVYRSDKQTLESKPHPFENPHFSQQLKIMQYTGLKDKNGKDIYEGDILERSPLFNWLIEYSDGGFQIANIGLNGYIIIDRFPINQSLAIGREIIGNIYENPELLNNEPNPEECDATGDAMKNRPPGQQKDI